MAETSVTLQALFRAGKQCKLQFCIGKAAFSLSSLQYFSSLKQLFGISVPFLCLLVHGAPELCPAVVPLVDGGPLLLRCTIACLHVLDEKFNFPIQREEPM